jgi:hypothetical protein
MIGRFTNTFNLCLCERLEEAIWVVANAHKIINIDQNIFIISVAVLNPKIRICFTLEIDLVKYMRLTKVKGIDFVARLGQPVLE